MFQKAISFIFPQPCIVCGTLKNRRDSISFLCGTCYPVLPWISSPSCSLCGLPLSETSPLSHPCADCLSDPPPFQAHRSLWVYREPVNGLIAGLKYGKRFDLLRPLAELLFYSMKEWFEEADFLIPIPLSVSRLRQRTYNQSLELARKLSRISGVPVLIHSLQKIKETSPQTELPRLERIKNLKHAFEWNDKKNDLKDKSVLLIDDVYTTGSTLKACSKILNPHNPRLIRGLTLAMSVRNDLDVENFEAFIKLSFPPKVF